MSDHNETRARARARETMVRAAAASVVAVGIVLGVDVLVLRQDVPPWWVAVAMFVGSIAAITAGRAREGRKWN